MGRNKRKGKAKFYQHKQPAGAVPTKETVRRFAKHLGRPGQVCQFGSVFDEVYNPGLPRVVHVSSYPKNIEYVLVRVWGFPNPRNEAYRRHTGPVHTWLYHGTREHAIAPIVLQGFRLSHSGHCMFGAAAYVTPNLTKAFGYTDRDNPLIFVCEAKLGRVKQMTSASNALCPQTAGADGFDTAYGKSRYTKSFTDTATLFYSEYAIYDTTRIHLCYLAEYKRKL
jgi:hypothetical protein